MSASKLLRHCLPLAGLVFSTLACADPAAPVRTILKRHALSGVAGKEVILGTAELPTGATIGWHTHRGEEAGYVLRGSLLLRVRGQPDRLLKAGDHFINPKGYEHTVSTAADGEGALVVSTWIVDADQPLAEPAAPPS